MAAKHIAKVNTRQNAKAKHVAEMARTREGAMVNSVVLDFSHHSNKVMEGTRSMTASES